MSQFADLEYRNVIRTAGLHLVAVWLILALADTLPTAYKAPGRVMKVLPAIWAIGFIPAMAFAWILELMPDGIRREEDVAPQELPAPRTVHRAANESHDHGWPGRCARLLRHRQVLPDSATRADSAIDHLRLWMDSPAGQAMSMAALHIDPVWDPPCKDLRFAALLKSNSARREPVA